MIFKLSDEQWSLVAPILSLSPRLETRGRPRRSDREVFEAALRLVKSWGSWRDISSNLAPYQTVFRRVKEWEDRGVLAPAVEALARDMEERGKISLRSCFMDHAFTDIDGKSPRTYIISIEDGPLYIGDPPEKSWQEMTQGFFQEPRVWRYLRACPSPWIHERLPQDLSKRLKFV